ncbi:ATP-binding cassette domain-containing protein [Cohnella caldifontis]|uniref:ATP-binding cassette domain-containing protein n=1 Tax=Cohnella caldifontis TaxID=3027471 RepID=UPI0023ED66DC|nr:ATP-binding cassette domain-containing protein [Cohnella sp. YIM B05605]
MASAFPDPIGRAPSGISGLRRGFPAAADGTGEASSPESGGRGPEAIRLEGVVKRFDDRTVLRDIRLNVGEGEFVAIVGRSGCGKSTLLRLVAGLETVSGGKLLRGGREADGIDPAIRVMFQDARLLPWKSVLDNVKIGIRGLSSKDAEHKAREALRLVGLEDRAGEWPQALSGGQRQRVALARALAGQPRILLFDEPLGALDALTRIEMQQLIERLWERQRFTALLVTHEVSEAVALADRVILIEEGRIGLDVPITLARPRERDSGFAHFEKRILDRVLTPGDRLTSPLDRLKDAIPYI